MHRRNLLGRALLVPGGILIGLLLGEGLVRILRPSFPLMVPWADFSYGIRTMAPNVRGRFVVPTAYDTTISTNSQMFRGREEYQLSPRPGVSRLALLGDSMTFGEGVNDDETYPARLGRALDSSVGPGRVEVLNAGIVGAGTGEEAWWFDVWVKRFHPSVVVLNVYGNDVDDDLARSPFLIDKTGRVSPRSMEEVTSASRPLQKVRHLLRALPGYFFLAQHSQLVNLLRTMIQEDWGRARKGGSSDRLTPLQIEYTHGLYRSKGLPLLAAEIAWLQERAQGSVAKLVVVYLPTREDIHGPSGLEADEVRWKSAAIASSLKETCFRLGIPFTDLTPQVRQEAARHPGMLYYNVWGDNLHANREGARVFAEAVAAFLIQEGIVAKE